MEYISSHAGMIGLLFFFAFFIAMAAWVYLPRNKKRLERHGEIPLAEERLDRQEKHHGRTA